MKKIRLFISGIYFHPYFFLWGLLIVLLTFLSYYIPVLYIISMVLFCVWVSAVFIDLYLLHIRKNPIFAERETALRLSNGDDNPVYLDMANLYPFPVKLQIIDEAPDQFQLRDRIFRIDMKPGEEIRLSYTLKPTKRGEYRFGKINVFSQSPLCLIRRRHKLGKELSVAVYPSIIQLRKYELRAISQHLSLYGIKKIRKIGNNNEFEKIKEYVSGDDVRTINWKATAKRSHLMVNQYIEERAQPIYNIIDMGRSMKMPFNGMTLLDYSINASLVLSNIALQKYDQAGLVTFGKEVQEFIVADRKKNQLHKILEGLYKQKTQFPESSFEGLQLHCKRRINRRSLCIIYTNFESADSMRRQLPYLRSIAKNHVVLVVFFYNVELKKLIEGEVRDTEDIYIKTIAAKLEFEKRQIVRELKMHGIYSVLTTPEALTIDAINKYLWIKSQGII